MVLETPACNSDVNYADLSLFEYQSKIHEISFLFWFGGKFVISRTNSEFSCARAKFQGMLKLTLQRSKLSQEPFLSAGTKLKLNTFENLSSELILKVWETSSKN